MKLTLRKNMFALKLLPHQSKKKTLGKEKENISYEYCSLKVPLNILRTTCKAPVIKTMLKLYSQYYLQTGNYTVNVIDHHLKLLFV